MKVKIIVQEDILKIWEQEVSISIETAKKCSISFNTLKNAILSGFCSQLTHDKINAYVLRQRKFNKQLINK